MNYKFKSIFLFLALALFSTAGLLNTSLLPSKEVSATIANKIPELGCLVGCFEGQGEQGPPGPPGPQGEKGEPGDGCANVSTLHTNTTEKIPVTPDNGASGVCTPNPPPSPSIIDGNQVYAPGYFD